MIEAKLKACPFCGRQPTVKQAGRTNYWWVGCEIHLGIESHGCGVCQSDYDRSKAIEKWNTRAGDREPEAAPNAGNIAGSVSANGSAYRYEALCQVCWKQFELPCEDAEHVCPSPHCQRVKLMKRCDYCKTRTHHETNGIGMWICTVCACDDTPNDQAQRPDTTL